MNEQSIEHSSQAQTSQVTKRRSIDLWSKALDGLDQSEKQEIAIEQANRLTVLSELLKAVEAKKELCVERQWGYTKRNGNVVMIRDSLNKISQWVRRFQEVGDAIMQYDTGYAALPWAGVRFLIIIATNENEVYSTMIEGVELVSRMIAKYAKVEELYLQGNFPLQRQLEDCLTELYTVVLAYLAKAKKYYARRTAARLSLSVIQSRYSVEKRLQNISQKAAKVDDLARIIDADCKCGRFHLTELTLVVARTLGQFMFEGVRGLRDRFDRFEEKFDTVQSTLQTFSVTQKASREQLLRWINATFTDEEFETAASRRVSGTCEWILQRQIFREWNTAALDTQHMKILWIHGPPGFGKTILAARLIQYLQSESPSQVVYFFCNSSDERKRQPFSILQSWVAQLINQSQTALDISRDEHYGKEGRQATTLDVWEIFRRICKTDEHRTFIVDGFDECVKTELGKNRASMKESEDFLHQLFKILDESNSRVLILSREDGTLRPIYRKWASSNSNKFLEYEITSSDTRQDITIFSREVVTKSLAAKSSDLKQEITETVSQRCQGMFLWIRLVQDRLDPTENTKELRKIVAEMPEEVESTYEEELLRILQSSRHRSWTVSIFRWILFAVRPLTVRELTEALVVNLEDKSEDYPQDDLPDSWNVEEVNDRIQRLCGSLVEFRGKEQHSPQDQTVHFVHFSVREYLTRTILATSSSQQPLDFSDTSYQNDLLAQTCLRFLVYKEIRENDRPPIDTVKRKINEYHFLLYAANCWQIHAQNSLSWSARLSNQVNDFFDSQKKNWLLWSEIYEQQQIMKKADEMRPEIEPREQTPLYYVSMLGFLQTLKNLKLRDVDYQKMLKDCSGHLHAAACNGHVEILQLLLNENADVNAKDLRGTVPLHLAAQSGKVAIVQLLLDRGAEVNIKASSGWTALHRAAMYGHLEVVKALVDQHAEVDIMNASGWTPLYLAAKNGYLEVVRFLVEQQASIHEQDNSGYTPVHAAAWKGHLQIVQYLLIKGALVDPKTIKSCTPLHLAALYGHLEIVRCLVGIEADVDALDADCWIPLHYAALIGHLEVARYLVDQKVDVNAKNSVGWTPLHLATRKANLEVARYLVDHQAEINVQDSLGWTPLHVAARDGHLAIARYLIDQGASVDAQDSVGWTPLHVAASVGNVDIIRLLVDQKAAVHMQDCQGRTALHEAAYWDRLDAVQYLQSRIDVNLQDCFSVTALHQAVYGGHAETANALIKAGSCLSTVDGYGKSALDWAARSSQFLLLLGYTPGSYNSTPEATQRESIRTSICSLSRALLDANSRLPIPGFNRLGRCLVFANDLDAALRCFHQEQTSLSDDGFHSSNAYCDSCTGFPAIWGTRYICQSCPDLDLCSNCMQDYLASDKLPACSGHQFLEVPEPSVENIDAEESIPSDVQEMLLGLIEKYSNSNADPTSLEVPIREVVGA